MPYATDVVQRGFWVCINMDRSIEKGAPEIWADLGGEGTSERSMSRSESVNRCGAPFTSAWHVRRSKYEDVGAGRVGVI